MIRTDLIFSASAFSLRLRPRGNVTETRLLCTPQFVDPAERECIRNLLRRQDGDFLFYDAGANIGAYTYWVLAGAGERARVTAFEANPAIAARLRENLARNGFDHVRVHEVALTTKPGRLRFHVDPDNLGESGILSGEENGGDGEEGVLEVPGEPLAPYLESEVRAPDLLKIDIEGAEAEVLAAAFVATAREKRPLRILAEFKQDDAHRHLHAILKQAGYSLEQDFGLNRMYRR